MSLSSPTVQVLLRRLRTILPQASLVITALPLTPDIRLHLLAANSYHGPLSDNTTAAVLAEPPYWSFCWASGQVLAKVIMDNVSWVEGRVVVDFGAGSGVVAIAAALAGAKTVYACDIDGLAKLSVEVNAQLNSVSVIPVNGLDDIDEPIDLIVAADVLYDRENFVWLQTFVSHANRVLLGDSRVKVLPSSAYREIGQQTTSTLPDLDEHKEFANVKIYLAGEPTAGI